MIQAAKATAHVLLLAAVCLPVFANIPRSPLVAEKPHQGVANFALTLHRAESDANALIATGFDGCVYDSGTWSCCSGKERDAETGLDYFLARYYSGTQGRFTSPDEFQGGAVDPFTGQQIQQKGPLPYADIRSPQTLNKYAYVVNNPLRYIDPDGHAIETIADIGFIAYDLNEIRKDGLTVENGIGLGGDVVGAAIPFATGVGAAARGGYKLAKSGEALEKAAQAWTGLAKNWERVTEGVRGAAYRLPDLLSDAQKFREPGFLRGFVGEVKNTSQLSLTNQLRDLFTYAEKTNKQIGLFVAEGTKFSKPLLDQIRDSGAHVYRYVDKKWTDVTADVLKGLK